MLIPGCVHLFLVASNPTGWFPVVCFPCLRFLNEFQSCFYPSVFCTPHSDVSSLIFVVVGGGLAFQRSFLNPAALSSAQWCLHFRHWLLRLSALYHSLWLHWLSDRNIIKGVLCFHSPAAQSNVCLLVFAWSYYFWRLKLENVYFFHS